MQPSSSSAITERRLTRRDALVLAGLVLLSAGIYLGMSGFYYHIGFPLDDAWIHQTYARNLAFHGEWAFVPGVHSGGSTAPLWSALLVPGFWLGLAPFVWAYLLGMIALWGIGMLGEKAVRGLVSTYRPGFPWMGAALVLEWHLVWASVSGMETVLYALITTVVLVLLISGTQKYFGLGLLVGLAVWVRPDGITLLGPVVLMILLARGGWSRFLRAFFNLSVGFGSVFALYLLFNLLVAGSPWPNTFYAKQAEYSAYLQMPILRRLGSEMLQPLIGVGVVLLPGFFSQLFMAVRKKNWGLLAAAVWSLGFLGLYAWRLPVTYQHGRYVIPAMPIYFLLGLAGLVEFGMGQASRWRSLLSAFWKLTAGFVLMVFWARGAFAYSQDVALIDSEMVATAKWVNANVPADALVAAHDIGALGYYGNHNIIDLAGLISPEVIPFIRDEGRLADYLDHKGVTYLIAFPDWYPSLVAGREPIFTTGARFSPSLGGMNMAVYRWTSP